MLNLINKILYLFWLKICIIDEVSSLNNTINKLRTDLQQANINLHNTVKEDNRKTSELIIELWNLKTQLSNSASIIEEDKLEIESLNKKILVLQSELDKVSRICSWYKELASTRAKELNTLRSCNKALECSRDKYKIKYNSVVWKLALKNACHK